MRRSLLPCRMFVIEKLGRKQTKVDRAITPVTGSRSVAESRATRVAFPIASHTSPPLEALYCSSSSHEEELAATMSYPGRPLPSHLRNPSASLGGSSQSGQSPVLVARIAEKKAELANLKELQALSAGLADQMQMLADKLSTLSDGAEGKQIRHPKGGRYDKTQVSWSNVDVFAYSGSSSIIQLAQRAPRHQHGVQ